MNLEEKREYGRGGARGSCTGNNSGRTGKQCQGHRHPGDSRSCGPTGAACEEVPEQETGPEKDRFQGTGRKWGSPEKEKHGFQTGSGKEQERTKGREPDRNCCQESKDSAGARTSKGNRKRKGVQEFRGVQGGQRFRGDQEYRRVQKFRRVQGIQEFRGVQELQKFR